MATPKTFTAYDIEMKVMRLNFDVATNNLFISQGYVFLDNSGNEIEELPGRYVSDSKLFSEFPQNIRDALIILRNHMYDSALAKESME